MSPEALYNLFKTLTIILVINLFSPAIINTLFGYEIGVIPLILGFVFGAGSIEVINAISVFALFPIAITYIVWRRKRKKDKELVKEN